MSCKRLTCERLTCERLTCKRWTWTNQGAVAMSSIGLENGVSTSRRYGDEVRVAKVVVGRFSRWLLAALMLLVGVDMADSPASAQSMGSGLMPASVARRYGLERAWFTQIEVGRSRGRVLHAVPYVSPTRNQTIVEVFQGPRRWMFSEHEQDAFRKTLGPEGVQKKAAEFVAKLKKNQPEAGEPQMVVQVVPEVTIYVTTDQAIVQAIDGETGKTRWITKVGNADYPTTAPAGCDNYVSVLNGSTLFVLSSTNGEILWQRRVSGVPGAGAAVTEEYVFAPMVNGAIESYTLADGKASPWIYKSIGRALVQPSAGFDSLAWPTDRGHLYVASSSARAIRYRLESQETVTARPTFATADRLIAPTVDGYLYCLNPSRQVGNIWWKYSTGETLTQSPLAIGDTVYTISDDDNLYAISVMDGQLRWKTSGVKRLLTLSGERLYVVGEVGRLTILDTATGSRIAVIPLDEFDLQVTNPLTDRIYYGTKMGVLQCLREIGHPWPTLHTELTGAKPKPKPKATPAAGKPEPGDDPFAAPGKPAAPGADDDPFAAPAQPGAAPKPAAGGDDDPFGAPAPAPKPQSKPADDADPFG